MDLVLDRLADGGAEEVLVGLDQVLEALDLGLDRLDGRGTDLLLGGLEGSDLVLDRLELGSPLLADRAVERIDLVLDRRLDLLDLVLDLDQDLGDGALELVGGLGGELGERLEVTRSVRLVERGGGPLESLACSGDGAVGDLLETEGRVPGGSDAGTAAWAWTAAPGWSTGAAKARAATRGIR